MDMSKLSRLPTSAGVYLFKDATNAVLYIGKATSLRSRVRSYFRKQYDPRIEALRQEITDVATIGTKNEIEASLLEAELIKKHTPRFNVLLKDGQPFVYLTISAGPLPELLLVRNKKHKDWAYFGPFLYKGKARSAHRFLITTFKLKICGKKIENGCLEYHLGLCSGSCTPSFDREGYLFRLALAQKVLEQNHAQFLKLVQEKIQEHATRLEFETARQYHTYTQTFAHIFEVIRTRFNPERYAVAELHSTAPHTAQNLDESVGKELQTFLSLEHEPHTIDCFDISHFQGRELVGSCIRFTNGKPDKNKFRRFKIKTLTDQNDYAALQEIVSRRYRNAKELPDLILIDGGKGQLNAVKLLVPHTPCISLAKREETLFGEKFPEGTQITAHTAVGRLLIALRDYAHHFAVSYHKLRTRVPQTKNQKQKITKKDLV